MSTSRRSFLEFTGSSVLLSASGLLTCAGKAYPRETGKTLRMGVVGGGFGSSFHWHEHPNCEVTGVTDLRHDRRTRLRVHYGCDTAYDSLEVMIKEAKDIDAVAVFTEGTNHAKHVRMCMDRGWHVVSAVPACVSLEEAESIRETKEKTGLKYMMAESSYYRQECILARNLFRSGEFGDLFYSEVEYYHDRGDLQKLISNKKTRFYNLDGTPSWRFGFPPMLYPTHSLGYLVGVTGERIRRVSCLGWGSQDHPYLKENAYDNPFWNCAAMMQTDQGHMCRCNVFWLCAAHGERAQWFGDRASLYMNQRGIHSDMQCERMKSPKETIIPEYWKSDMLPESMRHRAGHGSSAVFISAEFVNALLDEREPEIDLYDSLAMTVPGVVAHESALKNGEQLAVPQFECPAG